MGKIDESQFQSKPKHHRGRQLGAQAVWVFGIVDTSTNPGIGYMEVVDRRDAQTLLPIVHVCVSLVPSSTVTNGLVTSDFKR